MAKPKFLILISVLGLFLPVAYASAATIMSPHLYAWSNNVGYISFASTTVSDSALGGYAWSANKGFIKFNPAQGGVFNDSTGNLSGSAWGEQLGWIDFDNVSINSSTGQFSGTATGALVGTITFDCHFCDVQTDWRGATTPPPSVSPSGNSGNGPPAAAPIPAAQTAPSPEAPATGGASESTGGTSGSTNPSGNAPEAAGTTEPAPVALFDVTLDSAGLSNSVAPGESVAFSVKLVNLGSQRRADVTLSYRLLDSSGKQVYAEAETVAVDTTASFVKRIPVPKGSVAGAYTVETSLSYAGQQTPAASLFTFNVVPPSQSVNNNMLYAAGIGLAILLILGILYVRRVRTRGRFVVHDYFDKPKEERIYYEIISDTIGQMRQRAGDRALEVATHTAGLTVDEKTGRVQKLTESPAKVIAELVSGYEKVLGKKVSFSFRREKADL